MLQHQLSLPASSLLGSVGYSAMLAAAQVALAQAAGAMVGAACQGWGARVGARFKQIYIVFFVCCMCFMFW